jgi:hypothetical protein
MSPDTPPSERHGHRYNILIPVGVLIGLGAGILVSQIGAGVLIGLGFGMVAAALAAPYEAGAGGGGAPTGWFSGIN